MDVPDPMLTTAELASRPDFRLGEALVSPSRRRISGPGGDADVEPRVMQVLSVLADTGGAVVTRDTLFRRCWGGAYVGDDSLNRAIGSVRKLAQDIAGGSFGIETIPRTGYRLTGASPELVSDGRRRDGASEDVSPGRGISRRVLIGGGLAVAGAGTLGLFAWDRARDSSRVQALVTEADRLLRSGLSADEAKGRQLLQEALALQPGSAAANGRLAYHEASLAVDGGARDVNAALRAADRTMRAALAADPREPNALLARLTLEKSAFDWIGTEDRLRAIHAIAPRNASVISQLVFLLQGAGRTRASWDLNEQSIALDPLSPGPQYRQALKLWILGRYDDAYKASDRLIHLWPSHPWVWNARFLILAFTGRAQAALAMIDDTEHRPPNVTPQRLAQWRPTVAALISPTAANLAAAREANIAAARQSPGQAAYGAMALSGLGELDTAFLITDGLLLSRGPLVIRRPTDPQNRLLNAPSWRRTQWLFTPPMAGFRADRRFGGLCDGIGLTDYWNMRGIKPDYLTA